MAEILQWADVRITVDGAELFDDVAEVRYEERPPPRPSLAPVSYTASCTFEMDRAAGERLIFALTPNQRGVTEPTPVEQGEEPQEGRARVSHACPSAAGLGWLRMTTPANDYDEATCITAGELRAAGVPVPSDIPDVGWVPRSSLRFTVQAGGAGDIERGVLSATTVVTFTVPFRWVTCSVSIPSTG